MTPAVSAVGSDSVVSLSMRTAEASAADKHSYVRILKSTALIGGSSVVNILFGIVRTKAMALFLGPGGVGLMGLLSSIADLAFSLAGMGIQSSGVREIAEAVGTGEPERIARTAAVLSRITILLGLIGAVLLVALSGPISLFTFGTHQRATGVALLSVAVFLRLVSGGQVAFIQGMRRIADIARMNVLAAFFGTLISIPLVYFFRERGIVPSLIAVAAVTTLSSWWYSRKLQVQRPSMAMSEVGHESAALLKLGVAFMASGFLTMGAAYAVRIIVLRKAGVEAAGLYQSAWALGGLYVAFILQAMGSDFYPRLTAVFKDNTACNRLVNEQAQISFLLAGPGVIATLTLAPLVIGMFYSAAFHPAVTLLRWVCLGMTLRVVAWPMGFIVLAKGARQIFLWTEAAATAVHVGLASFFGLYLWHGVLIYAIVHRLSGFRWSATNRKIGMVFLPLTGFVFCGFYLFPSWLATTLGIAAVCLSCMYSVRTLLQLVPLDSIPFPIRYCLPRLGLAIAHSGNPSSKTGRR
jgi:antigen flippase